jgi:hypothetical protein
MQTNIECIKTFAEKSGLLNESWKLDNVMGKVAGMPASGIMHTPIFHPLNKWFAQKFKKLGWMVISKEMYNDTKRLHHYHVALYHLWEAIQEKMGELTMKDMQKDLEHMKKKVEYLISFVEASGLCEVDNSNSQMQNTMSMSSMGSNSYSSSSNSNMMNLNELPIKKPIKHKKHGKKAKRTQKLSY